MAETLTIRTASSTEVVKIASVGPQGPKGDKGDPGDVAGLPLTTQGDTLYRGASQNERLPIGTSGQILKVSAGGIPEWANESGAVTSVAGKTGVVTLDKNDVGLGNVANTAQVTSVTGTAPIVSSGGTTPAISISAATTSAAGSMSAADKTKLDGIAAGAEVNVQSNWTEADTGSDAFILNKPSTFAPSAHSSSHASAGSDPLAPSDIGAQSLFATTTLSITADTNLSAARATIYNVSVGSAGSWRIIPATTGSIAGDVIIVFHQPIGSGNALTFTNGLSPSGIQTIAQNERYRFVYSGSVWQADPVYTHTHAASAITSGTLTHERGGLEADVSAYNGLLKISGGSTSAVTVTSAGEALLDDADAAAQRTTLGLGTAATAATGDFAAASHSHGNINSSGQLGSTAGLPVVTTTAGAVTTLALGTAGQVLTVNSGATGVEFAAASGGGVTAVNSTLADILSVSGSDLVADDLGSDKLYGWDDSESKAIGFTIGSGLSVSGDTLSATASGGTKTYAVFTAEHNQPPSTAFATLDTRGTGIAVLDFDDATDESAVFVSIIPEGASLGSGLKIRLHWMATTATSGNVVWDVSLERMTTDLDADSFDTIASGTAAASGTSGILTVTEITLTTIDSVTAGDGFRLKVTRDANNGSDTMTGDAELVVCEVRSAA